MPPTAAASKTSAARTFAPITRTRRNPFHSRPSRLLAAISITVVGIAIALPFTALGQWFGFTPPPIGLLVAISSLVIAYLLLAQAIKTAFYYWWPPGGIATAALLRPHLPLIGRS